MWVEGFRRGHPPISQLGIPLQDKNVIVVDVSDHRLWDIGTETRLHVLAEVRIEADAVVQTRLSRPGHDQVARQARRLAAARVAHGIELLLLGVSAGAGGHEVHDVLVFVPAQDGRHGHFAGGYGARPAVHPHNVVVSETADGDGPNLQEGGAVGVVEEAVQRVQPPALLGHSGLLGAVARVGDALHDNLLVLDAVHPDHADDVVRNELGRGVQVIRRGQVLRRVENDVVGRQTLQVFDPQFYGGVGRPRLGVLEGDVIRIPGSQFNRLFFCCPKITRRIAPKNVPSSPK